MYRYAQINDKGFVVSKSMLRDIFEDEHMIPIDEDFDPKDKRYDIASATWVTDTSRAEAKAEAEAEAKAEAKAEVEKIKSIVYEIVDQVLNSQYIPSNNCIATVLNKEVINTHYNSASGYHYVYLGTWLPKKTGSVKVVCNLWGSGYTDLSQCWSTFFVGVPSDLSQYATLSVGAKGAAVKGFSVSGLSSLTFVSSKYVSKTMYVNVDKGKSIYFVLGYRKNSTGGSGECGACNSIKIYADEVS